MVVKIIKCPSCGEEVELNDLFEGMEFQCKLCNSVMVFQKGKILLLDTNEEFDIEELFEEYEVYEENFEEEEY
jgi:DNA-directed RNA polymerase subunit RPC12/RpoP